MLALPAVLLGATTLTAKVHDPLAAIEPPVRVIEPSPGVAVSEPGVPVPVQVTLVLGVGATTIPPRKVSVNVVSGTATPILGLFRTTLKRTTSAT